MSTYGKTFADEDEEIAELEVAEQQTDKEKTFEKRYGDLRSHTQKQLNAKDDELRALKEQLDAATKKEIVFPKSDEDIDEWRSKYPDVAKIVETLAMKQAQEVKTDVDRRLAAITNKERESDMRIAKQKLADAHPEFFSDIKDAPEFHEWLGSKSKRTQDVMYGDDGDYMAAIDVIDMFKTQTNYGKPKAKVPSAKDAAQRVRPSSTSTPNNSRGHEEFSESQINSMHPSEYDANEAAIDKAWQEGRVILDVTGGAR